MPDQIQQNSSLSTLFDGLDLTPAQTQVAAALAEGLSVTAAAEAAGLHRTTVHHWLRAQPGFRAAVDTARQAFAARLADQLEDLSVLALDAVRQVLLDPKASPSIRLRAAFKILERPRSAENAWRLPAFRRMATPDPAPTMEDIDRQITEMITSDAAEDITPRSAPCPCGSGLKYKRCCGKHAPPLLHQAA